MDTQREQFIKEFVTRGKQSGATKQDVARKLQSALVEYDAKQPAVTARPGAPKQQSVLERLGGFLSEASPIASTIGAAVSAPFLSGQARDQNTATNTAMEYVRMARAIQQKDPQLAESYRKKADSILRGGSDQLQATEDIVLRSGNISERDIAGGNAQFATRRGIASGLEAGAYMAPTLPGLQTGASAGVAGRIAGAGTRGGVGGLLAGSSSAAVSSEDVGDAGARAVTGAVMGAGLGAGMQALGEGIRAVATGLSPKVITPLTKEADKIDKLIESAKNPEQQQRYAHSALRRMYQSVFPFSKKGNAFERLKPEQTIDDMMRYNVSGSADTIKRKVSGVAGRDGVLTGVVDDAINTTSNQSVSIPAIDRRELYNRFSELGRKEVNAQLSRLGMVKPGKAPTEGELKALVALERSLKKEGFEALTKGWSNNNVKTIESGELKMILADSLSDAINTAVGKNKISAYKDPRIIKFLAENYSEELADAFVKAKTVADLRRLQTSFVRMNQIISLSEQMPSSVGTQIFQWTANIPVLRSFGSAVSEVARPVEQRATTGLANLLQQASRSTIAQGVGGAARGAQSAGNVSAKAIEKYSGSFVPAQVQAIQRFLDKKNEVNTSRKRLP